MSKSFQTSISEVQEGRVIIRGYSHEEIMRGLGYAESTFLTLVGRLPNKNEARLTETMLTSLLDHGFVAATVPAARFIASGNPEFVPSVAGGLLAAGQNTLSPEHSFELIESAQALKREQGLKDAEVAEQIVKEMRASKKRMPGFGHPIHRDGDFRAEVLFELAEELGLSGEATRLYRAIHRAFLDQTGRTDIPINIDGCLAALCMDLGLSAKQTVGLALLGVLPGLMAHVVEEIESGPGLRWIDDGEYTGDPYRSLPNPVANQID